jgi:hypothetical protein
MEYVLDTHLVDRYAAGIGTTLNVLDRRCGEILVAGGDIHLSEFPADAVMLDMVPKPPSSMIGGKSLDLFKKLR